MLQRANLHIKKKRFVHEVFFSIDRETQTASTIASDTVPKATTDTASVLTSKLVSLDFRVNGAVFAEILAGETLSITPSLAVHLHEAKPGDLVSAHWVDGNRERGSVTTRIVE